MAEAISDERARGIGRLLAVTLAFAVVLAVIGAALALGEYRVYGLIVVGIAVVLGVLGGLTLRATRAREGTARRLSIATGVAMVVLSVPLMPIWIGLLTVVAGIGLLVVTVAPERDAS
ncbi:hypothetical protein [Nocardioides sp.]|uniref:hypothetical protein n=1 Tax=Nocardioides sp. TaxID=35761 RepID=UPI003783504C